MFNLSGPSDAPSDLISELDSSLTRDISDAKNAESHVSGAWLMPSCKTQVPRYTAASSQ